MSDVFLEQLIKKREDNKTRLKKFAVLVPAIVIAIVIYKISFSIFLFVAPIAFFLILRFLNRQNIEYEYIFTSGELDIDKIINKTSRKHILSINVREFSIMVKKDLEKDYPELNKFDKVYDYSSGSNNDNIYIAMYRYDGYSIRLIFEPNEKLISAIRMYIPNKLKK